MNTSVGNDSRQPGLLSANLLYLVTMILILTAGAWMQARSFTWGLLATELGLILLPTLLWLGLRRLPPAPTLRLRWPGWGPVVGAALLGPAIWLFASWLGSVLGALLGYSQPVAAGTYPQTAGQALVLLLAFAVAAPVAEEAMFRGYIQSAYERFGGWRAIIIVGLLFAVYHLTLVGLGPRVPIALVLCWVAWRSRSLLPGIALHAMNNLLGALAMIATGLGQMGPGGPLALVAGWLALLALPLAAAGLWLFLRTTAPPERRRVALGGRGLATGWPLLLALLLFVAVAGLEVVSNRFPALLAGEPPVLTSPWQAPAAWQYRLETVRGDAIGEASCTLSLPADAVELVCEGAHEGFEFQEGNSYWSAGAREFRQDVLWDQEGLLLQDASERTVGENGTWTLHAGRGTGVGAPFLLTVSGEPVPEGEVEISPATLLDDTWPWRLSGLDFAAGAISRVPIVYPSRWDPQLERNTLTTTEETLRIVGTERLEVPAGSFMAWRVELSNNATAWYDVEAPHTLLKVDDQFVVWVLERAE